MNTAKKTASQECESQSQSEKLLGLLLSIGVEEQHIPVVTKQIDDLLEGNKKGDGDSSIDEPDVRAEAVHLDEFEALFRGAPSIIQEDVAKQPVVSDFKIQRKLNNKASSVEK